MFGKPEPGKPLAAKKLSPEEEAIHALAKKEGITRSAAAERIEAAKHNAAAEKKAKEEAEKKKAAGADQARASAEEAAGQQPSSPPLVHREAKGGQ